MGVSASGSMLNSLVAVVTPGATPGVALYLTHASDRTVTPSRVPYSSWTAVCICASKQCCSILVYLIVL